ncbi:MAG: tRNA (adenosine(37)-N6)-threonylcarbamoyltransferase complex ATPase subunit type 1 TsaE [Candidatus Eisenbacteria bacterium]|uniref:tRNA threonylcarbamoyladenosine biosynthesis protein TsaE n=1 Tax=Eiseniibacteriota bacterium TaxID=2212470 RepID=A0A849SCM8_UNCEI|nr:tRNA (adenosine(37)-N6)-threonylcarbamoyltransferase complex ATPase subunit type 1 TsaE [Candidatus Eisenbacteria bacterium]
MTLRTPSAAETSACGLRLAAAFEVGDVVALEGPLGAGKTRFVEGLARGLECKARVRSPSFSLVNEYAGRVTLIHLDLYRLEHGELEGLGLEEYVERGVLAVEWGERLTERWLREALRIRIRSESEDRRALEASAAAGRGLVLLEAWRAIEREAGSDTAAGTIRGEVADAE